METPLNKVIAALRLVMAKHMGVWYHGRSTKSTNFDYAWVGKGKDQEGPGFYFSSSRDDAASYAYPNGIVITARLRIEKLLPKRAKRSDIEALIKSAPNLEYKLSNWDENPATAFRLAMSNMMADSQPYLQVWASFYMQDGAEYLKNLVKLGYGGHKANRDGVEHLIVYDPSAIEIVHSDNYVATGITKSKAADLFMFGGCLSFAIALQKVIGGSIYCISRNGEKLHAFVRNSAGDYDVKGKRSTYSMVRDFSSHTDGWEIEGPLEPGQVPFKSSLSLEAKAAKYINENRASFGT